MPKSEMVAVGFQEPRRIVQILFRPLLIFDKGVRLKVDTGSLKGQLSEYDKANAELATPSVSCATSSAKREQP